MHFDTQIPHGAALAPAAVLVLTLAGCETPDIYNEEPPVGALRVGEVILVDDGSCPVGQIKEVRAGNRRLVTPRTRTCIEW
ncbi:MAG: DUF6719 family protein [Pseudomonadota bacterium]